MYEFNGIAVQNNEAEIILGRFKDKYINVSYPERILFINHLNKIDKIISLEKLRDVNISNEQSLYFYHERLKTVYLTNFEKICLYVEQLEPWEDIDCLVFDKELDWFIGITHNETLIFCGI